MSHDLALCPNGFGMLLYAQRGIAGICQEFSGATFPCQIQLRPPGGKRWQAPVPQGGGLLQSPLVGVGDDRAIEDAGHGAQCKSAVI